MVSKEDLENLICTLSSCRMDNSNTSLASRVGKVDISLNTPLLQNYFSPATNSYSGCWFLLFLHKHDLPFLCEANATKRNFSEVTRVVSSTKGDKTNICFTCVYS